MTKKIWRLLCIFSVFLAGILLYEGGVLVFRFQARREGLLTCFAVRCMSAGIRIRDCNTGLRELY